jgi:hypothetical protein
LIFGQLCISQILFPNNPFLPQLSPKKPLSPILLSNTSIANHQRRTLYPAPWTPSNRYPEFIGVKHPVSSLIAYCPVRAPAILPIFISLFPSDRATYLIYLWSIFSILYYFCKLDAILYSSSSMAFGSLFKCWNVRIAINIFLSFSA